MIKFLCSIFILLLMMSCASQRAIVHGVDERDANEILVLLSTKGIEAHKVVSTEGGNQGGGQKVILWNVVVKPEDALEAISFLDQNGLPRRPEQTLLSIFANTGLVPSETQEKIRYQAGLAAQIASTIRKIDGILDADVLISFPDEDPLNLNPNKQKITAAVFVKDNGVLDDPNTHLVSKIKRLVAASVPGLSYDNVTVVGDRSRLTEMEPAYQLGASEAEKQYNDIWSLIIANQSVFRFRVMFFSFTLTILILLMCLIWGGWKIYPLLKNKGGIKALFSPHQLKEDNLEVKEEQGKEEVESPPDKGIDET